MLANGTDLHVTDTTTDRDGKPVIVIAHGFLFS
jgi:hypothetical protein